MLFSSIADAVRCGFLQVCAFTSLGMLMAIHPITGTRLDGRLLPNGTFKKELDKLMKPHPLEPELAKDANIIATFDAGDKRRLFFRQKLDQLGIAYDEISTHSYRKGSASHAASGSTQGPPIVAVCLRAGWKLGGVLNTYLCLENAGDQFVGRVAAGLPLLTKSFAVLPPRFPDSLFQQDLGAPMLDEPPEVKKKRYARGLIEKAMVAMFGDPYHYGQSFYVVLKHCLASLCFHKKWLTELPEEHPWHTTWLARNPHEWEFLRVQVGDLKYNGDDDNCMATGIPPYTMLAQRLLAVEKRLDALPDVLCERMSVMMDEKGVRAGNCTAAQMQQCVQDAVRLALREQGIQLRREQQEAADAMEEVPGKAPDPEWHYWEKTGTMHKLPYDYVLSARGTADTATKSRTPLQAYTRWWMPDNSRRICALRHVHPEDFSIKNQRKRFSDWRVVCNGLNKLLVGAGVTVIDEAPDAETVQRNFRQAFEMFNTLVKFLHPSKTKRKRMRTRPQLACKLAVSTMAKDMRKIQKRSASLLWVLNLVSIQRWFRANRETIRFNRAQWMAGSDDSSDE